MVENLKINLFETVSKIRGMAAMIYDRGISAGYSKENTSIKLEPLRKSMNQAIRHCAEEKPSQCVMAIRCFESQAESYKRDIEFLQDKMKDSLHHAETIKRALATRMSNKGEDYLEEDGFIASLVEGNGFLTVSIK